MYPMTLLLLQDAVAGRLPQPNSRLYMERCPLPVKPWVYRM
jgi:hypothetical protein